MFVYRMPCYVCADMPRRLTFQHRKDKERAKRLEKNITLAELSSKLVLPSKQWCDQSPECFSKIVLCKLSQCKETVMVSHTLTIHPDLSCTLLVNNHEVNFHSCIALNAFVGQLNHTKLSDLLAQLERLKVCCGQPDEHYVKMVVAKKGIIVSPDGKISASVVKEPVVLGVVCHMQTVCTAGCEILSRTSKCTSCSRYRTNLRAMYNRWSKRQAGTPPHDSSSESTSTGSDKYINNRYLNTPEKISKLVALQK